MPKISALCGAALLCLALSTAQAQTVDSTAGKLLNYPTRFFGKLQARLTGLNSQLANQSQQYLEKMARREARLQQKLMVRDSVSAKQLFAGSAQQYAGLIQKLKSDTGKPHQVLSGQYQPYADSLQGELAFLKKNPQLLNNASVVQPSLQGSMSQLQAMQAKLQDVNAAKAFVQQRQQQISQYLTQHGNLQGLTSKYTSGVNQDAYYYSQRVNQYRDMLNDPGKLGGQALAMVSRLPAYQSFMKTNGQLAGLFKMPGSAGGGSAQPLPGLQTHGQITQQVQGQVNPGGSAGSGGSGGDGMGAVASKVQSAQSQLDSYKSKLSALGAGSTVSEAPSFRPNDQKTKTFWHRLEYGVNFQTTTSSAYYPTTTDFGASLGYRLGHSNIVGIGASYKMGWGSDIHHIAISGQGVGLHSFLQIAIKNGFSATGGFEYNYVTPFSTLQQLRQLQSWTRSGLIGLSKTVSMKSRVFKKTQVQLLWDFLSYSQVPRTQAVLFRVGYNF